jgi:toxin ParE1/3/4
VSYRLLVRPLAEQDLLEAQRWYDVQQAGLGHEFRLTIDAVLRRLQESPQIYPTVYRGIRRVVVRRFPYLLYFLFDADTVTVLACLHGRRHARAFRTRTP